MDIATIGAALAVMGGAATSASVAAQSAAAAAVNANSAASAANAAAENYAVLETDASIDRVAFNYAVTLLQAEQRALEKRLAAAEAKISALT